MTLVDELASGDYIRFVYRSTGRPIAVDVSFESSNDLSPTVRDRDSRPPESGHPGRRSPDLPHLDLERPESALTGITRALVAYLLGGDLQPGDRIPPERRLAEALGIGRSAVREALKALNLLGLIEVRPGNGTFLKEAATELLSESIAWGLLLGEQQIDDFVEAREHLEVILVGMAARRRTSQDLATIRETLDRMAAARDDTDLAERVNRFGDADVDFHGSIWRAAKNGTLEQVMSSIRHLLEVWIRQVIRAAGDPSELLADHTSVFNAIERCDEEGARAAMAAHLLHSAGRLRVILESRKSATAGDDALMTRPQRPIAP